MHEEPPVYPQEARDYRLNERPVLLEDADRDADDTRPTAKPLEAMSPAQREVLLAIYEQSAPSYIRAR